MIKFKQLLLSICLLLVAGYSSENNAAAAPAPQKPNILFKIADILGNVTDPLLTRGELSAENQALFEDMAKKMGIDHRKIEARNSRSLIRLLLGYMDAGSSQLFNRVYLNEDFLNELPADQKQFLMGRELAHHRNSDEVKKFLVDSGLNIAQFAAIALCMRTAKDNPLTRYALYPSGLNSYVGFLGLLVSELSLASLLHAQYRQYVQRNADAQAVSVGGADLTASKQCLDHQYNPNTNNWPWYGKIQSLINAYRWKVMSLPIFKQHALYLASQADREESLNKAASQAK